MQTNQFLTKSHVELEDDSSRYELLCKFAYTECRENMTVKCEVDFQNI